MQLAAGVAGQQVGPRASEIDARWLMAYAASLGDMASEYCDTTRHGGILAHPLFPVCYEWPLALDLREEVIPDEVAHRGVHATHDLWIHRRPRPGDRLRTTAAVTRMEPRKPGAYVVVRYETVDERGEPVSTTDYGTLYLGVACAPGIRSGPVTPPGGSVVPGRSAAGGGDGAWAVPLAVSGTLAHVYSECARIWNPIHTDRGVARAAGLADPILHGTATLGLALSEALRRDAGGAASPVRRIACRFGAMVTMPSTLTLRGLGTERAAEGRWIGFEVLTAEGGRAVRDGRILVAG